LGQDLSRCVVVERADVEGRESGGLDCGCSTRAPTREEQRHRVRTEPSSDESENLVREAIEPLRVIDHDEDRSIRGRVGQQRQCRKADQERILRGPLGEPERGLEGGPLWWRQLPDLTEEGPEQLVESGERQMRLGPHSGDPKDAHAAGPCRLDARLEERRLSDPGIASEQQHTAVAGRRGDKFADRRELQVTPDQLLLGQHRAILASGLAGGRVSETRRVV
jgi:hypothetical protein